MKLFKNIAYLILIISIVFINLQGFKFKVDIENIEPIMMMGLDNPDNSETDPIKLSFLRNFVEENSSGSPTEVKPQESANTNSESSLEKEPIIETAPYITVSSTSYTKALEVAQNFTNKFLLADSIKFHIVGENTAKNGLLREIEFLSGTNDLRLNSKLFIVKDITAEELFKRSDQKLYEKLNTIINTTEQLEVIRKLNLIDILRGLDSPNNVSVVPTIEVSNITGVPEVNISGLGILKKDKLIDCLDYSELTSYSILSNNLKVNIINTEDIEFGNISIGTSSINTKIKLEFEKDILKKVKYDVYIYGNLEEIKSRQLLNNAQTISKIETIISNKIEKDLYNLTNKSKLLKADFLRISDTVSSLYPHKWNNMKDNWSNIISNVDFNIAVYSNVTGSFNVQN